MPRQRPRRRRRRNAANQPQAQAQAQSQVQVAAESHEHVEVSRRRSWIPPASVVTALGFGVWLGWAFGGVGGIVEQITLWIGVLMAGLGGGRLFRRSLQSRQEDRNRRR